MRNIAIIYLAIAFCACSKTGNPSANGPKRIMSLTVSSLSSGTVVKQAWTFEYNSHGQLVKKKEKDNPANYTTYEYVGAIPIRIAQYVAGILAYEYLSPVTVTGNEIRIEYFSRLPSGSLVDSLVETYLYKDSLFTQADYAYRSAQGPREYRNRYYYDIGKLVQFSQVAYLNQSVVEPLTNNEIMEWTTSPNKLQKLSAFNFIFTLPLGDPLMMGIRHPQKYRVSSLVTGSAKSLTYTFDKEGYPLSVRSVDDNLVIREFTYDR